MQLIPPITIEPQNEWRRPNLKLAKKARNYDLSITLFIPKRSDLRKILAFTAHFVQNTQFTLHLRR